MLNLGLPRGDLLVAFSEAVSSPPPIVWLPTSQLLIPCFTCPLAALAFLSSAFHPYDSKEPQAAGADSICQQRECVANVSGSEPASLLGSCTLIYKFHTCACPCPHSHSVTNTYTHRHRYPDTSWQYMSADHSSKVRRHYHKYTHNLLGGLMHRHDTCYSTNVLTHSEIYFFPTTDN